MLYFTASGPGCSQFNGTHYKFCVWVWLDGGWQVNILAVQMMAGPGPILMFMCSEVIARHKYQISPQSQPVLSRSIYHDLFYKPFLWFSSFRFTSHPIVSKYYCYPQTISLKCPSTLWPILDRIISTISNFVFTISNWVRN